MRREDFLELASGLNNRAGQLAGDALDGKPVNVEEVDQLIAQVSRMLSKQTLQIEAGEYSSAKYDETGEPFTLLRSAESILKVVQKSVRRNQ